jgi:hypothetical protein
LAGLEVNSVRSIPASIVASVAIARAKDIERVGELFVDIIHGPDSGVTE